MCLRRICEDLSDNAAYYNGYGFEVYKLQTAEALGPGRGWQFIVFKITSLGVGCTYVLKYDTHKSF